MKKISALFTLLFLFLVITTGYATDQRIQYSESMTGANYPANYECVSSGLAENYSTGATYSLSCCTGNKTGTCPAKSDTLNRMFMINHNSDGSDIGCVETSMYADLNTAHAAAVTASLPLIVNSPVSLSASLTITVPVIITSGTITKASNYTITFDNTLDGPLNRQVFIGFNPGDIVTQSSPSNPGTLNLTGPLNEIQGANIASASTVNIGAGTGNYINITGTTTITAFDTIQAGAKRILNFNGSLILTYNASSLILPGEANITTATGDTATFISLGSGNWICTSYTRAASFGAGTVSAGTSGQLGYYATSSNAISGTDTLPTGTKAATQSSSDNSTNVSTTAFVKSQSYVTSSALSGYATQSWVLGQSYVTSSALSGYATQSWVNGLGYATQSWVTNQISNITINHIQGTDANLCVTMYEPTISTNGGVVSIGISKGTFNNGTDCPHTDNYGNSCCTGAGGG